MINVMENHGVDTESEDVKNLCADFETYENPFAGIESAKQQNDFMINELMLVPPTERAIGTRLDKRRDHKTGEMVDTIVTETFQYIPILEVLKLVLTPRVRELINEETQSTNGTLKGYCDGEQYKQHDLFRDHPNALRIQLYYDDVEVTNPLGSKTGVHKLGLFYYSIQNLPRRLNSSLNSVMLLAVCYASDLKKYGFEPILRPFVKEMKQMERDSGVDLFIDGEVVKVHGALVSFSGDSLAVHEVLGFLSPAANKLCRLCKTDRDSMQVHFLEEEFELRSTSIEEHDECAELAAVQRGGDSESGVKTVCVLNSLRCFHSVVNFNLDIMHDMAEGVCPCEVKLLLHHFILVEK